MTVFTHTSYTSLMNSRIASSVACEVGFAAIEVEARAAEAEEEEVLVPIALEEVEEEEGGGRGRCSRRKRMLHPVRKSEMCEVEKRSIIF